MQKKTWRQRPEISHRIPTPRGLKRCLSLLRKQASRLLSHSRGMGHIKGNVLKR
jgi:hypothetical protein